MLEAEREFRCSNTYTPSIATKLCIPEFSPISVVVMISATEVHINNLASSEII